MLTANPFREATPLLNIRQTLPCNAAYRASSRTRLAQRGGKVILTPPCCDIESCEITFLVFYLGTPSPAMAQMPRIKRDCVRTL
jgi:hypothetical protein